MPRSSASKKSVVAGERDRPDGARRRAQWIKYQDRVEPERLIFIDETWTRCPCRKPIDWRLTENRAMLLCNERSFQAHCLGGCRSVSVAGSARGRDFNVAATDHCSATNRPQETNLRCHRPIGVRWSLSPLPSRS